MPGPGPSSGIFWADFRFPFGWPFVSGFRIVPAGRRFPPGARLLRILLIDNNDSFTRNLEHLLVRAVRQACADVRVDVLGHSSMPRKFDSWDMIVISPGPGAPRDYAGYGAVMDSGLPVLGVCLGMQIINVHFGGSVDRLADCVHGKTDTIRYNDRTMSVGRYHSLYCSTVGKGLRVAAANDAGVPMIVAHESRPVMGMQFHPESFLTEHGEYFIHDALQRIVRS